MSYHTYGATNIAYSTFDIWANNVSSDTNAQLDTALNDFYPAQSNPHSVSTLQNTDIFYGSATAGTGGTVELTNPYSVGATSGTIVIKNMDLGENNPTLVAAATYPYTFDSWRTASGGGGSQISTNTTLTITTGTTQATTYYAYFTTTHSTP